MIQNDLKQLVDLQEIDLAIDRLNASLKAVPAAIEIKRGELKLALSRVDEEKARLVALQLKKKEREIQVGTHEDGIKKNEMQLNTLKSNESYKAMLSEIAAAKKQKSAVEDEILSVMEEMEQAAKNIKLYESEAKNDQQKIEGEIRIKEEEISRLKAELAGEQARRDAFIPAIKKELLAKYETLRKKKKGSVLAAIINDSCAVCNTQIPSSVLNEVKKVKDMTSCETCSSILYFPAALAPAAPAQ